MNFQMRMNIKRDSLFLGRVRDDVFILLGVIRFLLEVYQFFVYGLLEVYQEKLWVFMGMSWYLNLYIQVS